MRMSRFTRPGLCAALAALALPFAAAAQPSAGPQPLGLAAQVPAARDVAYPGVIDIAIDATDIERRIFLVRQTIPVAQAGPMTLLLPKWLPGNHAPRGPAYALAGLRITADGRPVPWRRDPLEVYAYHLDVPEGAQALEVSFQHLSPTASDQGRVVMTPEMLNLQWEKMTLYPAGHFTRRITVRPQVRLPAGWDYAVALDGASRQGDVVSFAPVPYETLVDSPMFAGEHFKAVTLDETAGRPPVRLNIFADSPELLEADPAEMAAHRALVAQSDKLFGSRPFDRYDFLLALTDRLGGIGLEHHRSSENSVEPRYFLDWDDMAPERDLLPHEYVHSWNGKFRRGADLWTPDYLTPMSDTLLWVYEGQTQYWGYMLSARSGLWSKETALEALAQLAATYDVRRGRAWRPLGDTTHDPIIAARRPIPWVSWQRSEDYYSEGLLVWLEVDTLIREKTNGRKSLDDFARAFFGVGPDGDYVPRTYAFDDVVAALNGVVAHDWAGLLTERLEGLSDQAPFEGLRRGGYRLVYRETPTEFFRESEALSNVTNLTYSLGLTLRSGGAVSQVVWDSPAYESGLTVGNEIVAVNGMAWSAKRLKDAVTKAKDGSGVELIVKEGEAYRTVKIDYRGGLRYPHLERVPGTPARLDQILAAR